jgi:hypothetical protein
MHSLAIKISAWALGTIVSAVVLLTIVVEYVVPEYDANTRAKIMQSILLEVPVGSNAEAMEGYMLRHVGGFELRKRQGEYVGVMRQSRNDRNLFPSRRVTIHLKFDSNHTFTNAEVWVTYTVL